MRGVSIYNLTIYDVQFIWQFEYWSIVNPNLLTLNSKLT
jgi:hypothetical protein